MNRRHFIKCGMAAGVAIALGRKVARAYGGIPQIGDLHPPIDVTGKPTPDWLPHGEPGVSYFQTASQHCPKEIHCYLNGTEVTHRASECGTEGGWVRMYDVDHKGNGVTQWEVISQEPFTRGLLAVEHIHFGKVEIR